MKKSENLIRRVLGKPVSFEYSVGRTKRRGWYKPYKSKETWSDSMKFVEENWTQMSSNDIRLFVGNETIFGDEARYDLVFALPGLPTMDIIELAKTGVHNNSRDHWREVKNTMQAIFKACPFEIQFADEAGLHATFLKYPSVSQAKTFFDMISEISPEVFENLPAYVEEGGFAVPKDKSLPEFPDIEAASEIFMTKMGKLRLWWD